MRLDTQPQPPAPWEDVTREMQERIEQVRQSDPGDETDADAPEAQ